MTTATPGREETFDSYADLPEALQKHLRALEDFVGEVDGKETVISTVDDTCIHEGNIDATEAVHAFNEIIAALRLAAKPREAFKPFSDFMAGGAFNKLPDDMKLTQGSSLAHRQLTVGDFKKLRSAIWPSTTGEPKS